MNMRKYFLLLIGVAFLSACEIEEGDFDGGFDWDSGRDGGDGSASPEDDAGTDDAGRDASTARDSGSEPTDAGHGDAGADGGGMMMVETPEALAKRLANGSCAALTSCMGPRLLMESLRGQDCVSYRTRLYQDRDLHWLPKSVEKGRVTFKPELLAQCEADLKALACEVQTRRVPQSCIDAANGDVEADGACAIDQECEGKAFCDKGSLETCPGSCAKLQTAGLPCRSTSQCADGLLCRGGMCEAPLIEGDECTTPFTAADAAGYGECPPGLVCQGTTGNLHCQSVATVFTAKLGQQCSASGTLCELGLVCQSQSSTSTMGVCAAPVAKGATCRRAIPGQCPSGQYCKDARANVTARAPAGTDGVCADMPTDGKACESAVGCQPGAVCLDDGMCHALKGIAQQCSENRECYGGSCLADVCTAPLDCTM
jgi:Dickkopf N-terminal cysteine-rich region